MDIHTHSQINADLCGTPVALKKGYSRITLLATAAMTVDGSGLVHGGFIFGLADYAAMLAVNHPNVVLAAAAAKFLKPVKVGDRLLAEARMVNADGKKQRIAAQVQCGGVTVFTGEFDCAVLSRHVLSEPE
jgi:uncharacterized protein (TIGR00369 family)